MSPHAKDTQKTSAKEAAAFAFLLGGWLLLGGLFEPCLAASSRDPVPASLKSGEVNLRVGPGVRYPINWVLLCQGMPVRIVEWFDLWRKIQDPLGSVGWVHKSLLSRRGTLFILQEALLRKKPDPKAAPLARIGYGAIVDKKGFVQREEGKWYDVKVAGFRGYIVAEACWDPGETRAGDLHKPPRAKQGDAPGSHPDGSRPGPLDSDPSSSTIPPETPGPQGTDKKQASGDSLKPSSAR